MPPKTKKTAGSASASGTPAKRRPAGAAGAAAARTPGSTKKAPAGAKHDTNAAIHRARAKAASKNVTPAEAAKMRDDLAENKKKLKELKALRAELQAEHDALLEVHTTTTVELEDASTKLGDLQRAHEVLKAQSDSHAGASTESLSSYQGLIEDHARKLETVHNDLQTTLEQTLAMSKELAEVKADITALRKSNAALKAAAEDNGYVADEADAALDSAVADLENAQLELVTMETELDEAKAVKETTVVEIEISRQQLDQLAEKAQTNAVQMASTESARNVELEHGKTLIDAMRRQLDGFGEAQNAAESESADLRVEAAEHELKLERVKADIAARTAERDAAREALAKKAGTAAQGSAELHAAEARVHELEERLASYAAIESELKEHRAREKVSAALQAKLEGQIKHMRDESAKLRESTLAAKQTVTDTLKGKLAAVQEKNKVAEELAATEKAILKIEAQAGDGADGANGDDDAEALAAANARNIDLQAELSRLEAQAESFQSEVGSQL